VGELITRGPYTICGYYRSAEHNRTAFTPDGYYRTGDLVRVHASGNLVVEGRKKDLVNRGGEKISAEEVENLILAHEKVQMVAVVAMRTRSWASAAAPSSSRRPTPRSPRRAQRVPAHAPDREVQVARTARDGPVAPVHGDGEGLQEGAARGHRREGAGRERRGGAPPRGA